MTRTDSISTKASSRKAACRRLALAGALAAATFVGAPGASAQMFGFMPDVYVDIDGPRIPPRGVVRRLQNRGFVEIGRPRFDGEAYIVEATHPSGSRMRIVLDAYDGAMLGRRVIGPAVPPERVARAAPGYGWTDEETGMRRAGREFGGPIPPADIPMPGGRRRDAAVGAEPPGAAEPYGVGPDAKGRPSPASRKTARLTPPQKPGQPQAVPPAPEARIDSPQAAKPREAAETRATASPVEAKSNEVKPTEAKPIEAKVDGAGDAVRTGAERTKPDEEAPEAVKAESASPDRTPGAAESPTTGAAGPAPVTPAANQPASADKGASETPRDQAWKDIEPARKNVRVIDGATVVPGSEALPSSTN